MEHALGDLTPERELACGGIHVGGAGVGEAPVDRSGGRIEHAIDRDERGLGLRRSGGRDGGLHSLASLRVPQAVGRSRVVAGVGGGLAHREGWVG